jgi:nitrate reductase NapD
MSAKLHISSLVVQTRPERFAEVHARLLDMGAEIPASDPCGKLVVVLETDSEAAVSRFLDEIASADGVLSANLVYHLVDAEEAGSGPGLAPPPESQQQGKGS